MLLLSGCGNNLDSEYISMDNLKEIYPTLKDYRNDKDNIYDTCSLLADKIEKDSKRIKEELGEDGAREALSAATFGMNLSRRRGLWDTQMPPRQISQEHLQKLIDAGFSEDTSITHANCMQIALYLKGRGWTTEGQKFSKVIEGKDKITKEDFLKD